MSSNIYETVIGIEVHVQLNTKSKMFCSCPNVFASGDNENICPVCTGMPGALPSLNSKAIELAVKTGLALGCEIHQESVFSRKNYFYPDMPRGYQISQYQEPICGMGYLDIKLQTGGTKRVGITRAHLEEDAGKSIHYSGHSSINLNRASTPLLEIVSEPELSSPVEAAEYVRKIRSIVRYLDVCDGNLEEGSLRADCNISVRPVGQKTLGTKVELKNLNSFRFIEKALDYEIARQIDMWQSGEKEKIVQETRLYDPDKNRTFSMRAKETDKDYRYFNEPDLLSVLVPDSLLDELKNSRPMLAADYEKQFVENYGLKPEDASRLTQDKQLAEFYVDVCKQKVNPEMAAKWIMRDLMAALKDHKKSLDEMRFGASDFAELMGLIENKTITQKMAVEVFAILWETGDSPEKIVKDRGMTQISDSSLVESIVDKVINENPSQVEEYKAGKHKVFAFFVGKVMKASQGKANPDLASKFLKEKLK